MPYRRKIRRRTLGKDSRKMAGSRIISQVVGAVILTPVIEPTAIISTAGTQDVFENADFNRICSPNSIVKYMNLRFQVGIKKDVLTNEHNGWVEYAVVEFQEQKVNPPPVDAGIAATIGTKTLGEMCDNLYREKCIWTGAFELSLELPRVVDLKIKLPPKFCANKVGRFLCVLYTFRSALATDNNTETRNLLSWQYKVWI